METIIIVLNPEKLANPDLDLRYRIPERIEEISHGAIRDNGYDYIDCEGGGPFIGIWLETESAVKNWSLITKIFLEEKFLDNDLSLSAEIYISEHEGEDMENCIQVYPK